MSASGPVFTDWAISVSSGVTASAILYGVRSLRRFGREHQFLMESVERHSSQIDKNTAAIEVQGSELVRQGRVLERLLKARPR